VLHIISFVSPFEVILNFVHTLISILKPSCGALPHIFAMGGFRDICGRFGMLFFIEGIIFPYNLVVYIC